MFFWTYGHQETWLDIWLKIPVPEDRSTSNMINGPKNCSKLNDSTITRFIDTCEGDSGWKRLSGFCVESLDCFLIHWLLVTGILFLIETIYRDIFRFNYLRNEKCLLNFFFAFSKFRFNFEHFRKKDDPHSSCIFNLWIPKDVVR